MAKTSVDTSTSVMDPPDSHFQLLSRFHCVVATLG